MATAREVERKYEVPVEFTLPDLRDVDGVTAVDEPAEHQLDAVYYDTPQLRLAANRVTLRRRTGGNDAGWHIKRPSGADRSETHIPLEPSGSDVPAAVLADVRPLSRGEPLEPVVRIQTRRLERALRDADGRVLALVADDLVTTQTPAAAEAPDQPAEQATGAAAVVRQWREVEVELVDGAREVLDSVESALATAGAHPSKSRSKLAQALGDRYPADPPRPGNAAWRYVADYLVEQRDTIVDNDAPVRAGDPEAVHDMRVATRRLRSTLRTYRDLFDQDRSEPLRDELRWLGGLLGAVRDSDVMATRLADAIAAEPPELILGPVAARVHQRLAAGTAEAREELVAELDGPRYTALLDELDAMVSTGPATEPDEAGLRRIARKTLRRADRRLAAADRVEPGTGPDNRPDPHDDRDTRLHEARKAYKRARYAAESLRAMRPKPADRLVSRLKDLQDVLGDHQDSIITQHVLREYGVRAWSDGENAFSYGLLHARQREAGELSLADLPAARRRAGAGKARRWLSK